MEKLKVLDLFSGIGGFSLGLERTGGFETVAFCEIDPFCQKVLKKHWPEVKQYHDITRAKFTENVDLVTAGFPCQDISCSGQGAGLTGERSSLFWYILRTLCMVGRPRVLLENVADLLAGWIWAVLGALASFGYDAEWHCIPASYVGASHERDRIFIMGHPRSCGRRGKSWRRSEQEPSHRYLQLEKRERNEWGNDTGVCRVAYGIPNRSHRIKALGNSVVPAIPEIIGHAILQAEGITA